MKLSVRHSHPFFKRKSVLNELKSLHFVNNVAMKYRYEQMKLNEIYHKMKEKEQFKKTDIERLKLIKNLKRCSLSSSSSNERAFLSTSFDKQRTSNLFERANIKGTVIDKDLKRCQRKLSELKYKRIVEGDVNFSLSSHSMTRDMINDDEEDKKEEELALKRKIKVKSIVEAHDNQIKRKESIRSVNEMNFSNFIDEINDSKVFKEKLNQVNMEEKEEKVNENNHIKPYNYFQHRRNSSVLKETKYKLGSSREHEKYRHSVKRNSFFIYKDFESNKSNLFQQYQPQNFFTKDKIIIMHDKYRNDRKLHRTLRTQKLSIREYNNEDASRNVQINNANGFNKDSRKNSMNDVGDNIIKENGNIPELTLKSDEISDNEEINEKKNENGIKKVCEKDLLLKNFPFLPKRNKTCIKVNDYSFQENMTRLKYKELNQKNLEKLKNKYDKKCVKNIMNYSNELDKIGCKIAKVLDDVSEYFSNKIDKLIDMGLETYS